MPKKTDKIIEEIAHQYLDDSSDRPWIIGFSGGKDSTVLLTLVWQALQKIECENPFSNLLKRKVYVVCNDTMVENPVIAEYIGEVLDKIEKSAPKQNIPIIVKKTTPKLEETFWINVIGKGYPVPNTSFRWCTDRLKIRPTSSFLHEQIDEAGEAIVLLGTRYDESKNREDSMRKHEREGKRLARHTTDINTWVYAPIKELMLEDVWYIINTFESPWGFDNSILVKIYSDASADDYECPTVVTSKDHKSCGQSRFGCWTCTVVKKDKSMSALVENGQPWLEPLLEYRDELLNGRNKSENRSRYRRNGQESVDEEDNNRGVYTFKYRAELLEKLLQLQKKVQVQKPNVTLITNQELVAIQVTWNRDLLFERKVGEIYESVYNEKFNDSSPKTLSITENRLLNEVCETEPEYVELIDNLITLQETKSLLISKYGLHNDVEKRIEEFVNPNPKKA